VEGGGGSDAAVDRPGFGLTDPFDYRRFDLRRHAADFVVSILDELGLSAATLIGGSMGGFFSLAAALAHPERVRRLILVGMPVGLLSSASWQLRISCGVPGLSHLFMRKTATLEGLREQYRNMLHIDPDSVPELYFRTRLAGLAVPEAARTWAVLLRRLGGLRGVRTEVYLGRELSSLLQPTLILWGERDMAPAAEGEAASCRIPECTFETMAGIGHFPFLEAPLRTAESIRASLARSPGAR
jgi:pimeloyl-ACP methyl ester carboxylesterase